MGKEKNAYILGTDKVELYRLGLQHQVWASEAQRGWKRSGFKEGDHILDLGCGPGFCSEELSFVVGKAGHIYGIDQSEAYIKYATASAGRLDLPITYTCESFDKASFPDAQLDGMYCRWALAWLPEISPILQKVYNGLKNGGKICIHEYYNWTTLEAIPHKPGFIKAIKAAYKSMKDGPGDIDIGKLVPPVLAKLGYKNIRVRTMNKLVTPADASWQWPKSFFKSYFPRLVEMGHLTESEMEVALAEFAELETTSHTTMATPLMVEIIAEK